MAILCGIMDISNSRRNEMKQQIFREFDKLIGEDLIVSSDIVKTKFNLTDKELYNYYIEWFNS